MPTWNEINKEIDDDKSVNPCDEIRKKYLSALSNYTKRPVICYYSGWLQNPSPDGRFHPECAINDNDMNGLMAACHGIIRICGLDLVLHTPGGGIEATRAIVEYLFKMFGRDIRVIVPQMAMSAGTMIACAAKIIVMGKHSCLGPTDPQIKGFPAMGILAEVDRAMVEINQNQAKVILWQQVFSKYPPAFLTDCQRSIDGTRQMVSAWLESGMLSNEQSPADATRLAIEKLMDYGGTSGHDQHFLIDKCKAIGLKIEEIEADQNFQERILSVHHALTASFNRTNSIKLIENSIGSVWSVNTSP